MNKNYQRILTLGKDVLPFIFEDLARNGGHWYWALECITGADPAADAVDIPQAKKAWLDYGFNHGYIDVRG